AVELARWLAFAEREPIPSAVTAACHSDDEARALGAVATAHGLAPLLHYRAKHARIQLLPSLASALAEAYHANLARTTYFYQELARVLDVARGLNCDVLILKGAHLAATLYPTAATRPMIDVDLLVRREQVESLVAALCARNYHVISQEPQRGVRFAFEPQVLLAHVGRTEYGCVALHWSLLDFPFYQQRLRTSDFWERTKPCTLAGVSATVLADEELLVYLAVHVALHHQWSRLIWLCDIALLLARAGDRLDWARVLAVAEANTLTLALRETLHKVAEDFGVPLAPDACARLDAATISAAERRAWDALTQPGRGAARSFWDDLLAIGDTRARAAFAFANLFPSPAYMRRRYGVSNTIALPVAYVRRWLRGWSSWRTDKLV
ncbi:MAG: nucleotidyltransferase family protein, partial [Chloroflexota bacterium]